MPGVYGAGGTLQHTVVAERTPRAVAEQQDLHAGCRQGRDGFNGAGVRLLTIVQAPELVQKHSLRTERLELSPCSQARSNDMLLNSLGL